jgi:hypothetical protein
MRDLMGVVVSRLHCSGVGLVLVMLALAAAGCGSSTSASSGSSAAGSGSSTASVGHLPTAKFVLHAGLAFGAFHRYIYKPFKAGSFTGGSIFKHKLALVKAGLAGLFAYHELKLAVADARASPTLSKLLTPVDALAAKLSALGSSLKGGHLDPSSVESANSDITSLAGQARQAGASVVSQTPSAAQVAGG